MYAVRRHFPRTATFIRQLHAGFTWRSVSAISGHIQCSLPTIFRRLQSTSADTRPEYAMNSTQVMPELLRSGQEPWKRSQNLQRNSENDNKHDQAVNEITSLLQLCKDIDVVKLAEDCRVSLVVKRPNSELGLGVAVRATATKGSNGVFTFNKCRRTTSVVNICALLPLFAHTLFRFWCIPGEYLTTKSGTVCLRPSGKWGKYEVCPEKLASIIIEELERRTRCLRPLSEWVIPKSERHQTERALFLQMEYKVLTPLGCIVQKPQVPRRSIDVIINGIRVQNKTAVSHNTFALTVPLHKSGGRNGEGRFCIQPYSIDDGIDALVIHVQREGDLVGLFIFPHDEMIKRGFFQGDGHKGKTSISVYPPYVSPQKHHQWVQQWQLEYYLDLNLPLSSADLDRARKLLRNCER